MSEDHTEDESANWDSMVDAVMDLIPAQLTNREWRTLRASIHNEIWSYVSGIFEQSEIAFRSDKHGNSEIRLWMSVASDAVDFQKGFSIDEVLEDRGSVEELTLARDLLNARIEALKVEEGA